MTIVTASLGDAFVQTYPLFLLATTIDRTFLNRQSIDVGTQADGLAFASSLKDGIKPRTPWYIMDVKASEFLQLSL